jgi:hypothetical protein
VQALEACLRAGEIAVTKRILFPLLPLFTLCTIAVCALSSCNNSVTPANSAPTAQPAADAAPPDDIPPVDPIWDAMAKKQAHLDQVEKIRTGNSDAVSCQKAVPGLHRAMKVDTSHCNAVQLRIEKQAEHDQLFDHMVKTLRHEN